MKVILDNIKAAVSIGAALIALVVWTINYHGTLATTLEVNQQDFQRKLDTAELKVLLYTLHGVEKLGPVEKGRYERANLRLISLEAKQSSLLGVPSD